MARVIPMTGAPPPNGPDDYTGSRPTPLDNEDAVALEFAERYVDEMRFCHDWGQWLRWDGSRWAPERTALALEYARQLARESNPGNGKTTAKSSFSVGVERFARVDRRMATTSDQWDKDPWLLATPGGTVELKTGIMRAPAPSDQITKRTAVTPSGDCDCTTWLDFLNQATQNDVELTAFLKRMCGYALTGDVREHALFFAHGNGGNGKGVFINTMTAILGDYATVAAMETFVRTNGDKHPTDLAMLRGARMVTAQETEEGRAWSDVRIKALTGGDPITARFMKKDFFTFLPTFKLIVAGNHKPNLRSVDDAMRRRLNLIPFVNKPAVVDPKLFERLTPERPGILAWAIAGCLEWQEFGLQPPPCVREATAAYFEEQDSFAQWIEERCDLGPNCFDTTAALYGSWKSYAESRSEFPGSSKTFSQAIQKAGFDPLKNVPGNHGQRGFKGLRTRIIRDESRPMNYGYDD